MSEPGSGPPSREQIKRWLVERISGDLETDEGVDVTRPLTDFGLESQTAIGLTGDLEDWLDVELDPTIFFDYPTIEKLAEHLEGEARGG